MTVYFAGPLFTGGERAWNAALAKVLRNAGHVVTLPQEGAEDRLRNLKGEFPAKELFEDALAGVKGCDIVVAILDGPDPDSGTCFECGYAYALGRPIVAVRGDLRPGGDDSKRPVNLMLARSAQEFIVAEGLNADPETIGQRVLEKIESLRTTQS